MPGLIRHPERPENPGFRVKPGMTIKGIFGALYGV